MKHYKNLDQFIKRNQNSIDWEDYFILNNKLFNLYEYGPGPGVPGNDYCYWLNKRTNTLLKVDYICPSSQFIDGKKTLIKPYSFLGASLEENADLWR